MSSSDLALSARDVSKRYTLSHGTTRHSTLAEQILHNLRHPFERREQESFWALRDISFDVPKGEVVGIIGRNGAGKSTLLKILSQITEPTTGSIHLYGNVGSLLEIGTGFHPELTGRENIFLNGAILGMRRRDIQRQFNAIIEFAGVEKFLDTPVKRYSSGMYIRLAFAVAAHLNPDILIVDEVLAVGDADFQKKCLGKMHEVSHDQGRTVLFVSHNVAAIRQLCTQAIYLDNGRMVRQGAAEEVLDLYAHSRQRAAFSLEPNEHGISLQEVGLTDAQTGAPTDRPTFGRDYFLNICVHLERSLTLAAIDVRIFDEIGTKVSTLSSVHEGLAPFTLQGEVRLRFHIPKLCLFPGRFIAGLEVSRPHDPLRYLNLEDVFSFEVQPAIVHDSMWAYERSQGMVRLTDQAQLISSKPVEGDTNPSPASVEHQPTRAFHAA